MLFHQEMVEDYELQGFSEANQLECAGDDDLLEEYDKGLDQEWSCWEMIHLVPYKGLVVLLPLGAANDGCEEKPSRGSPSSS